MQQITNSIGMRLARINAGTFEMGSPASETGRWEDETLHTVTLTGDYYLGIVPVTQEKYRRLMDNNPSFFEGRHSAVDRVVWDDAVAFCRRLSNLPQERTRQHLYRLPTEAEWEHACRAGSRTRFSYGDDADHLHQYAWHLGDLDQGGPEEFLPNDWPGRLQPNAWGLYDMHGGVWDWCRDWYGEYPNRAVTDPHGPPDGVHRVTRGGSWACQARICRSARRSFVTPTHREVAFGFRVAMDAPLDRCTTGQAD